MDITPLPARILRFGLSLMWTFHWPDAHATSNSTQLDEWSSTSVAAGTPPQTRVVECCCTCWRMSRSCSPSPIGVLFSRTALAHSATESQLPNLTPYFSLSSTGIRFSPVFRVLDLLPTLFFSVPNALTLPLCLIQITLTSRCGHCVLPRRQTSDTINNCLLRHFVFASACFDEPRVELV